MISIGSPCPDFQLPDDTGATVSLASLQGKPFVLFFYPKDDTSGCTQEAIDFTRLKPEFTALGVELLGVSPDPVKKHGKFRDKHELGTRLLADEEKVLLGAFGVWCKRACTENPTWASSAPRRWWTAAARSSSSGPR